MHITCICIHTPTSLFVATYLAIWVSGELLISAADGRRISSSWSSLVSSKTNSKSNPYTKEDFEDLLSHGQYIYLSCVTNTRSLYTYLLFLSIHLS